MDEARLSAHERRVLAEIEADLSADDRLASRMGEHRQVPRLPRIAGRGGVGAVALGALTLTLLVLAVATSTPALIWAFAAAWVVTLILLLRMVVRWTRRRAGGGRHDD
ncbi:DUF3040 domain-containing protein [Streptomyces sp. R302]|uniref:DUF3040 domain-containing protein n=1 Tax=unclassified Streptomyces TaxID=2593676 RepID=UPI00145F7124|nr:MULTISPECIES: DUF3040 domain-containing protein [unclassified Streptomyces]NML50647.1 DUF3040 domain-containing protein [Streptomyces sp. R301]NML80742.1 DUF3040 domain-containing protein [Streptomyces sp. R302]